MVRYTTYTLILAAVALSACSSSSTRLSGISTQTPPQALPSVPSGEVQTSELDPLGQPTDLNGEQPNQDQTDLNTQTATAPETGTQTAAIQPESAKKEPLTHEPLAGAWNVNSDSANCRAILSFTQWSGGYRATTLRCNSPELSSVTAWDIKGSQVVLFDNNGTQVASLSSAGNERYSGRTASGKSVSFGR